MRAAQMLLEREQDLDLLAGVLAEVGSSGGRVVLIRGEAGIGKSSLVAEFIAAHSEDAHVHIGWCDDLVTPQPLGPFWDIARSETSLSEPLVNDDRRTLLDAVMHLLSRTLRPTILLIEDTQWADQASLDAVQYLGRRIEQTNGLLLLTYRDVEVDFDHPLRGVIGGLPPSSVVRMQLSGLSLSAVAAMLAGSDLDPEEVIAATGGNPFLVGEMAATDGESVPSAVQDSVLARVGRLSPRARERLKLLCVIPERISRLEVSQLTRGSDAGFGEIERRGFLEVGDEFVAFHHDLIRRAVEDSLTTAERVAANRTVLEGLPPESGLARFVHHAHQANDIARLVEYAPRAAMAAVAVGSHRQAVDHFRQLTEHLNRLDPDLKGPLLDTWAREERVVPNLRGAIRLNELALTHYREMGDRPGESAALADAAQLYEHHGQRAKAEELARQAIDVLGDDPDGSDLANALEVNAYLAVTASDRATALEFVDRTLEAAGPDIDERILIRTLNHRGCAANLANYPDGWDSLDEARRRAEAAGDWREARRALLNHGDFAIENRDIPTAADSLQEALAYAVRYELPDGELHVTSSYARVLELKGEWDEAERLARDLLDKSMAITQMVALSVLGAIEARQGRLIARTTLAHAWEMAVVADELQRLGPAASAIAEHAWITRNAEIPLSDIKRVMRDLIDIGLGWPAGSIALWLWKLGELGEIPEGIAEPYRLAIAGQPIAAAEQWATIGCPYERAIALSHGDDNAQLEALESLETLGAVAVAAKLRKTLRDRGVSVPRRRTSDYAAGLTGRQTEVLVLLAEHRSNADIADELFLSPRTVEHHVAAIMSKLNASSRYQAVETAIAQGLLASR